MNKYKICVYAICKNEEQFVDRWMDSMSEADIVVVTDTGSEDRTVERLRERGAIVYIDQISPWRFDVARNISLNHIPLDVDICVCTDLDEVFEKGWRECIEKVWTPDTKSGTYIYNWSLKPDGTPDVQFRYFKVHARDGFQWEYPVHEVVSYVGKPPKTKVFIPSMVLNHYPDSTKSRGSYLPLLELAALENPNDDRMVYYLGREYMYKGEWQKCIDTLNNHLALDTATWDCERCASMRWIAKSYFKLGKTREAFKWYYKAIAQMPTMREPYIECAKMAYELNDWATVYYMVEHGLKIKERSSSYVNMGYAWDHTPNDLGAISSYQLGMYKKSLDYAKAAVKLCPTDKRLANNLRMIQEKIDSLEKQELQI